MPVSVWKRVVSTQRSTLVVFSFGRFVANLPFIILQIPMILLWRECFYTFLLPFKLYVLPPYDNFFPSSFPPVTVWSCNLDRASTGLWTKKPLQRLVVVTMSHYGTCERNPNTWLYGHGRTASISSVCDTTGYTTINLTRTIISNLAGQR